MKIAIERIKVAERIRKAVGNIEELAANIREHGLIAPIAVMELDGEQAVCSQSYQLLAGLRRLRAMQLNGEVEIDAKVFPASDAEAVLKIEYSENEQREGFTYSERMDYARLIEEIETAKARERMSLGGKGGIAQGTDLGPYLEKRERRDIIGEKIGMSGKQYDRAKYIADNAPPEIIEQLDRRERTIRGTYDELRAKEKSAAAQVSDDAPRAATLSQPARQAEIQPHTRSEKPVVQLPSRSPAAKTDPMLDKLKAEEADAILKRHEFDGLPPEGKIEELQRRLKAERVRAASAESELVREKELRQNEMYHYNATIEMLNNQLDAANARIRELEEKYERGPDSESRVS